MAARCLQDLKLNSVGATAAGISLSLGEFLAQSRIRVLQLAKNDFSKARFLVGALVHSKSLDVLGLAACGLMELAALVGGRGAGSCCIAAI